MLVLHLLFDIIFSYPFCSHWLIQVLSSSVLLCRWVIKACYLTLRCHYLFSLLYVLLPCLYPMIILLHAFVTSLLAVAAFTQPFNSCFLICSVLCCCVSSCALPFLHSVSFLIYWLNSMVLCKGCTLAFLYSVLF